MSKLYVAVIITKFALVNGCFISDRSGGDWGSFVGIDRDALVANTLRMKDQWEAKMGSPGKYTVLVGVLGSEAKEAKHWEEVPLESSDDDLGTKRRA